MAIPSSPGRQELVYFAAPVLDLLLGSVSHLHNVDKYIFVMGTGETVYRIEQHGFERSKLALTRGRRSGVSRNYVLERHSRKKFLPIQFLRQKNTYDEYVKSRLCKLKNSVQYLFVKSGSED